MSKSLCCVAFDALYTRLNPQEVPISLEEYNERFPSKFPLKAPLFVTWNRNKHLRGCIGTFLPLEIEQGTKRFAINAAFNDPRFPGISKKELTLLLDVDVTLLDNFVKLNDCKNWVIGEPGLKVSIYFDGVRYSGTYLPVVAIEQGWDQVETLESLLHKADFEGISKLQTLEFYDKGIKEGWLELESYEGKKANLNWDEYKEIRESFN